MLRRLAMKFEMSALFANGPIGSLKVGGHKDESTSIPPTRGCQRTTNLRIVTISASSQQTKAPQGESYSTRIPVTNTSEPATEHASVPHCHNPTDTVEAMDDVPELVAEEPARHVQRAFSLSGYQYRASNKIDWFPKSIALPASPSRYESLTIVGIDEATEAMEKLTIGTRRSHSSSDILACTSTDNPPGGGELNTGGIDASGASAALENDLDMPTADEDDDIDMVTEDPRPRLKQFEPSEHSKTDGLDLGADAMDGLGRKDCDMIDAPKAPQAAAGGSLPSITQNILSAKEYGPQESMEDATEAHQRPEDSFSSSFSSLSSMPSTPLTFNSSISSAPASDLGSSKREPVHADIEVEPLPVTGCNAEYDDRVGFLNRLFLQFERLNGTVWRNSAYKKSALTTTEMNKCAQMYEKHCANHGEVIENPHSYQDMAQEVWIQLGLEGMSPLEWKTFCENYREEERKSGNKPILPAQVITSPAPHVAVPYLKTTTPMYHPWSTSHYIAQSVPPTSQTNYPEQSNLTAFLQSLVPPAASSPSPSPTLPGLSPTELLNILNGLNSTTSPENPSSSTVSTTTSNSASTAQPAAQPVPVVAPPLTTSTALQTTAPATPIQRQLAAGRKRARDSGPDEEGEDPALKIWKGGKTFCSRVRRFEAPQWIMRVRSRPVELR
ncbi:uncharacterized protein BDZ99DRAFT_495654 [Mytilinidion resinicola]|uniref:Uncharacterized protein n=1 Tax=Mytilinidion resinicola TaxID=574789 RepID=A0A6A6YYV3_9PEZI|nr:uncharacterized protein BDZ99DRAFT_495654 [Mytilinidion resinicola]KAF2814102.1 hypothetical protein BDZ99DRAFT_495654 [Mytilinidion resinicola]